MTPAYFAGSGSHCQSASAIDDYLAVRRALRSKLEDHGWLLADFAFFMEAAGAVTVTSGLALA